MHRAPAAQIDRQVAGSFVYGLSALFYQECTVKDGAIEQTNFDTYDSMRIAQMPKVESIIMPSGGNTPWGGVGEPTICVVAPAVLNAYFKATGKRIRSFPLKKSEHRSDLIRPRRRLCSCRSTYYREQETRCTECARRSDRWDIKEDWTSLAAQIVPEGPVPSLLRVRRSIQNGSLAPLVRG
jgi:hypothetical protein